ncbi:MAG: cytochrome c3 family protein [Thermodesulfobacteriota bacterium]|nr:cytochrome c3 family protein [Thermodesulfobacteriota bacterium]
MIKGMKTTTVVIGLAILMVAGLAIAGTEFKDVIQMENEDAYEKHTKSIATFTHKKHVEEHDVGCGECHHDEDGKPLTDLKKGDDVQECVECHKPGRPDRASLRGLSREEREAAELEYHYGAIHQNCQGCHEEYNKEKAGNPRKGPAPVSCNDCHPREPR